MPRAAHKLNIRLIDDDPEDIPLVLIEGNKQALEHLAKLIQDHAKGGGGCGTQFWPRGPGNFFAKTATHGIYIHLLPCDHPTAESKKYSGRRRSTNARTTAGTST